tara:strand:- start:337 stop:855 length:519 start_codon:yes stop_codon:yes gene_type:complete
MRQFLLLTLTLLSFSNFAFNFDAPVNYIDKVSTTRVEDENDRLLYFEVYDQNTEKVIGKVRNFRDYERLNLLIRSSAALNYSFTLPVRESDGTFDLSNIVLKERSKHFNDDAMVRGTSMFSYSYELKNCEDELADVHKEMALEVNRKSAVSNGLPTIISDITNEVSTKTNAK